MTDKPQIALEQIELIPHPMDAWRTALDAIIACAPGDESAIAWHLANAQAKLATCLDRTPATAGTRQLVDRLMLIGAGRLISDRLSTETLLQEATRANGKCLLTKTEAAMRTATHKWSAPTLQLAIRDINALSPEHMRLIIQDVLRRQALEQQDSLVEADIGAARQSSVGDANDLPSCALPNSPAGDGIQRSGQQAGNLGAVDQPERSGLSVSQPVMVDETVVEPSPVRPSREVDIATVKVNVSLHVDA